MAVQILIRSSENLHCAFVAVDIDNDILSCFALNFQSVKTGELGVGTEVSAHVAVNRNASQRRDGCHNRFSAAGVVGVSTERSEGYADFVFRVIPFSGVLDGVPHEAQVKTFAAGEFINHFVRDGFLFYLIVAEVDIQSASVIAFDDGLSFILVFSQQLVFGFHIPDFIGIHFALLIQSRS